MQTFKDQLQHELLQEQDLEALSLLQTIEKMHSLDEIIQFLLTLQYAKPVRLVADYQSLWQLLLANPKPFMNAFADEALRAWLYQACQSGELTLAQQLINRLKATIPEYKVGAPHSSLTVYQDGRYSFHDQVPVLYAAIKSNSVALVRYILGFYDLTTLDNSALRGELQTALCLAAKANAQQVVEYLLSLGVNVNSEYKNSYVYITALYWAIVNRNEALIKLLVDQGATVSSLNKYHLISYGQVNSINYLVSKDVNFDTSHYSVDDYLLSAIKSGSKELVHYLLETLSYKLYRENSTEKIKANRNIALIKAAMASGSVAMIDYLEHELKIPVTPIIQEQINTQLSITPYNDNFLLQDAVGSYCVRFTQYLFEDKKLLPTLPQLQQLVQRAYGIGSGALPHHKLTMHAYIMSYLCSSYLNNVFKDVSQTDSFQAISNEHLFVLYCFHREIYSDWSRAGHETTIKQEILNRNFSLTDILTIANTSGLLANCVIFFLIVSQHKLNSYLLDVITSAKKLSNLNCCRFMTPAPIDVEQCSRIAMACQQNKSIETISFAQQPIGDRGVKAIINSIASKPCSRVSTIDLCKTGLTQSGVNDLIDFLKTNKSVVQLTIEQENDITADQLATIANLCAINKKAMTIRQDWAMIGFFGSVGVVMPAELSVKISNYLDEQDGRRLVLTNKLTYQLGQDDEEQLLAQKKASFN